MMDHSITIVTPQIMRQRGADAFDRGQGVDDHNMNPGTPAIADWQAGYCERAWARLSETINKCATDFVARRMTPP